MGEEKPVKQKTMIDQFNDFTEAKGKTKARGAKGPIDLKSIRRELNDLNSKNRRPS